MGRIIGVLNYKGGTGKTTTVVNLAAGLALRGARVLCVDLDAQGGLAAYLGLAYLGVGVGRSLGQLLLGQAEARTCIVPVRHNLDLIPSDRSLLEAEGRLWRMADDRKARNSLRDVIRGLRGYDYIFLDFSPSVSLVGECGLLCVRELIVPVAMNYLALVGTRQVMETLKTVSQVSDHHVRLSFIIPAFYRVRLRKDREIVEVLQRYFGGRVSEPIREDVKLAEAPGHGKSIYEYAPSSPGAADYARLVERVASDG